MFQKSEISLLYLGYEMQYEECIGKYNQLLSLTNGFSLVVYKSRLESHIHINNLLYYLFIVLYVHHLNELMCNIKGNISFQQLEKEVIKLRNEH